MHKGKHNSGKGKKPFPVMLLSAAREELFALSAQNRAEFIAAIDEFEAYGPGSLLTDTDKIYGNMFELRAQSASHWLRGFYFHYHQGLWIITHIFAKKTNKTPKANIATGLNRYALFIAEQEMQSQENDHEKP